LDEINPSDQFTGPSEFTVEFLSGSFTGKSFSLVSHSIIPDHEYIVSRGVQKILSKPLQDPVQSNLKNSSFVNWAWQADTLAGVYPAIFATDPNVSKAGDLQLILTNNEEFISSIPKGTLIDIKRFGGPQGAIEGNMTFTSALDYRINSMSKREQASINITFKIKRGPIK
jgi:hypothetical protein